MPPKTECPEGYIRNPATNRCVKIDGKIGKSLLESASKKQEPISKKSKTKTTTTSVPKPVSKKTKTTSSASRPVSKTTHIQKTTNDVKTLRDLPPDIHTRIADMLPDKKNIGNLALVTKMDTNQTFLKRKHDLLVKNINIVLTEYPLKSFVTEYRDYSGNLHNNISRSPMPKLDDVLIKIGYKLDKDIVNTTEFENAFNIIFDFRNNKFESKYIQEVDQEVDDNGRPSTTVPKGWYSDIKKNKKLYIANSQKVRQNQANLLQHAWLIEKLVKENIALMKEKPELDTHLDIRAFIINGMMFLFKDHPKTLEVLHKYRLFRGHYGSYNYIWDFHTTVKNPKYGCYTQQHLDDLHAFIDKTLKPRDFELFKEFKEVRSYKFQEPVFKPKEFYPSWAAAYAAQRKMGET